MVQQRPLCVGRRLVSRKTSFWLGLCSRSSLRFRVLEWAQSSVRSDIPALGSSFAPFRFLTISEMDDLVPFLQVWRGHRQFGSSWEALRGFQKLGKLGGSSHLPVSSDKELASHDGQLVSEGIFTVVEK